MKVTVTKYLNARIERPSTDAACQFYHYPGDTIEIDNVLEGTEIDGNSIWYHCKDDGCYYWSGGIAEIDFDLNIDNVPDDTKMLIQSEAIQYYWDFWKKTIKGFTGASIDLDENGEFYLSFQLTDTSEQVPDKVFYKGIAINTKKIRTALAKPELASPGSSISRVNQFEDRGSVAIKAFRKEDDDIVSYLITNYHVVASDLIRSSRLRYKYPEPPSVVDRQVFVPAQNEDSDDFIGALMEGRLTAYYDIALVRLRDGSLASNRADGADLTQFLDVTKNPKHYIGQQVTLLGAASGKISNTLRSVTSHQVFGYPGNNNIDLLDLLQISKYSQPGDSGGPVLFQNKIIGIHVGADDTFSYAIPIKRVLDFYHLKISQS